MKARVQALADIEIREDDEDHPCLFAGNVRMGTVEELISEYVELADELRRLNNIEEALKNGLALIAEQKEFFK